MNLKTENFQYFQYLGGKKPMLIPPKCPIKKFTSKADEQAGLTLIESVVAIAVIGITVAVASPVVVLSVATRVQNQRAEQAWRLAQSEIDNIRLLVERGGDYSAELGVYPETTEANIQDTAAPTSFAADFDNTDPLIAREVSIDGDNVPEFAVQVFRTEDAQAARDATDTVSIGFEVVARVYDHRAAEPNLGALETDEARLGLTGPGSEPNPDGTTGGGTLFGNRARQPLAVVYTTILQGERDGTGDYCQYWEYIEPGVDTDGLNCS